MMDNPHIEFYCPCCGKLNILHDTFCIMAGDTEIACPECEIVWIVSVQFKEKESA